MIAPKTVLAIDGDRELLEFYTLVLGTSGYRVVTAATADEVTTALAEQVPDLVMTDVRLPDLPPWAVISRLEADPKLRNIPVLVCSGAAREIESNIARLRRSGTRVLAKPFDIDELLRCVEQLLSGVPHEPSNQQWEDSSTAQPSAGDRDAV